ncbi:Rhodanese-related sulfurtransferase [Clostridium cavendishii DSM 21758]|uniref:Rhodanese-related sulfurtransferase n=1 Tax=Clostridium cavendishii DSM 21758 TaxID=1121302 RepID=A0A1M6PG17_9CLOT|nr:rhodanese-like domain-containing protein [Clostridium cavendishii]SHK06888.1 Rhodanese-related sulfurtransferase [Clostridium cavendishii DSM 21758]
MKNLTIKEAYNFIHENPNALILDVRTIEEYSDGHLPKSTNIPLAILPLKIDEIAQYENTPVLVYCQRGGRSYQASIILEDNGFTDLYNMANGFAAWTYEFET